MAAIDASSTSTLRRSIGSSEGDGPSAVIRRAAAAATDDALALCVVQRRTRMTLFTFRGRTGRYVAKLARSAADSPPIVREHAVLTALPAGAARYAPAALGLSEIEGRAMSVLSLVDGAKTLRLHTPGEAVVEAAAGLLDALAAVPASPAVLTREGVEEALWLLGGQAPGMATPDQRQRVLETAAAWGDATEAVVTHGDCTAANLLYSGTAVGLIDWSNGVSAGLPHFDRITLARHLLIKPLALGEGEVERVLLGRAPAPPIVRPLMASLAHISDANRARLWQTIATVLALRRTAANQTVAA